MYRIILCMAAALLTLNVATGSAAADDREVCQLALRGGEALAACSRLIKRNPKDANAYRHRGDAYSAMGDLHRTDRNNVTQASADYTQAIADYSRAIDLDPKSADAYAARAFLYRRKTYDQERAIADYGQVIKLNPNDPNAYIGRAGSYSFKNDYDRAIADLDQAIRLDPQGTASGGNCLALGRGCAYHNRGEAYSKKREYDRAIADFDQSIRLNPKSSFTYDARGLAYEAKGDLDRAIADYDEAVRLYPTSDAREHRNKAQAALAARPGPANPPPAPPLPPSPSSQQVLLPPPAVPAQVAPPALPSVTAERRAALVIGNSKYAAAPLLPNPKRDAEAVAEALRQDGFQTVILKTDLARDALRDALRTFRTAADSADWGLIYYAGHGIQIGKTNYLVPVDARLTDERDVEGEAVAYGELEKSVSGAKALRLIILDACRTDPFEKQMARVNPGRALARGLSAPPDPEPGLMVVYSAKDGQIAEDGDGANSPFAAALVAQLKVPGREVRRLFDFVRDDVMNSTGRRQQPFTYGSLPAVRDYYFLAGR